jgi:hypothetical protein
LIPLKLFCCTRKKYAKDSALRGIIANRDEAVGRIFFFKFITLEHVVFVTEIVSELLAPTV